ncbi:transposase [Agromyces bauzanensis]
MATDALTAAADELYGLVPEEFTAARNARAKDAKAAGDRDLGDHIGALKKPSPAAWIVNQLVRRHPDELDELHDLGEELREAQASGDGRALTRIGGERRKLLSTLLQRAIELADAADGSPSRAVLDEVEQTFIAATVDEAASGALATGRLVRSLQAVGFEPVDLDGAVAGEASAAPRPKRRLERTAREREGPAGDRAERAAQAERDARAERDRAARKQAETDLRDARERADAAQRALAEAEDLLHAAEWNADELRDERHELETRLKELRTEISEAERDEREAERVRAKAAIAADRARDDVEAAEAALDGLD